MFGPDRRWPAAVATQLGRELGCSATAVAGGEVAAEEEAWKEERTDCADLRAAATFSKGR
jgi:hypothetical protein